MMIITEDQPLGISWSSAFHIEGHLKKMLRPAEAIQYGMATLFSSVLSELLKDYNGISDFLRCNGIGIVVRATPSFADKNPSAFPGVVSNVHLFLKDLQAKCVYFILSEQNETITAVCVPSCSVTRFLMGGRKQITTPQQE
jgi:hypothetical protein